MVTLTLNKKRLAGVLMTLLTSTIIVVLAHLFLRFNSTPSLPEGIYIKTSAPIHRGDFALVCLPSDVGRYGLNMGYLAKGDCAGGITPVLKQVIAMPSDRLIRKGNAVCVKGNCYEAPIHTADSRGNLLTQFKGAAAGYFLYGAWSPDTSWDSRYFGRVPQSQIIGRYRLVASF